MNERSSLNYHRPLVANSLQPQQNRIANGPCTPLSPFVHQNTSVQNTSNSSLSFVPNDMLRTTPLAYHHHHHQQQQPNRSITPSCSGGAAPPIPLPSLSAYNGGGVNGGQHHGMLYNDARTSSSSSRNSVVIQQNDTRNNPLLAAAAIHQDFNYVRPPTPVLSAIGGGRPSTVTVNYNNSFRIESSNNAVAPVGNNCNINGAGFLSATINSISSHQQINASFQAQQQQQQQHHHQPSPSSLFHHPVPPHHDLNVYGGNVYNTINPYYH